MPAHEIEIKITGDGIIEAEVKGVLGTACEGLSKWIDELGKLISHKRTKDARKQPVKTVKRIGL